MRSSANPTQPSVAGGATTSAALPSLSASPAATTTKERTDPPPTEKWRIFHEAISRGRKEIVQRYGRPTCILSTKLTIKILELLDIQAEALPVSVAVFNAVAVEALAAGHLKFGKPMANCLVKRGAYTLGLTKHLVALAGDLLIDPSIDQADRPQHSIQLEPFYLPMTNATLRALLSQTDAITMLHGGNLLIYRQLTEQWHLSAPWWLDHDNELQELAQAVLGWPART
jgi:hypothetical protein